MISNFLCANSVPIPVIYDKPFPASIGDVTGSICMVISKLDKIVDLIYICRFVTFQLCFSENMDPNADTTDGKCVL